MRFHKADPVELEFQFRALPSGETQFEGYAAVFDQPSKPLFDDLARGRPYVETLRQGTFRRSLGTDQRKSFVVDHDERKMIASTPSGPLRLSEDTRGLHVASPWPSTDYANNVRALHDAGERMGMSILFAVNSRAKASFNEQLQAEQWNDNFTARTVNEATLKHVAVLATMEPAYDGTIANFRALADLTETDVEDVDALMEALRSGRQLDEGEYNLLKKLSKAVKPKTAESAAPVAEPEIDADRAAHDQRVALLEAIEASLQPKS